MNGIVVLVLTLSVPLSPLPVKAPPTTPQITHQLVVVGEAGK